MVAKLMMLMRGTIFHPQWLSDRYHFRSKKALGRLRNAKILDIGSGNSEYKGLIHTSNTFFSLDYPSTNKNYLADPQIFSDARHLPFGDEEFDVILLFEVLEHIAETQQVVKEIRRVLRPGGAFYLSVPFIYPIHDAPNDYWRFTVYGVETVLQRDGFEVTKLTAHGNTLVAALQMFNLGLLEICRDFFRCNKVLGLLGGMLIYPITFAVNLLAFPWIYLPLGKAGNFGYFLEARKKVTE